MSGRCLCGEVTFDVSPPLGPAGYCHCTRCQRRTGSGASAQVRVQPGADLWSRDPASGEIFSVRMAAFDGDPGVRPSYRQFVDSAASWEEIPDDGLDRFGGSAWSSGGTGTIKT